jgi:hypothetical protein
MADGVVREAIADGVVREAIADGVVREAIADGVVREAMADGVVRLRIAAASKRCSPFRPYGPGSLPRLRSLRSRAAGCCMRDRR